MCPFIRRGLDRPGALNAQIRSRNQRQPFSWYFAATLSAVHGHYSRGFSDITRLNKLGFKRLKSGRIDSFLDIRTITIASN